jgi:hypothetical protein
VRTRADGSEDGSKAIGPVVLKGREPRSKALEFVRCELVGALTDGRQRLRHKPRIEGCPRRCSRRAIRDASVGQDLPGELHAI